VILLLGAVKSAPVASTGGVQMPAIDKTRNGTRP